MAIVVVIALFSLVAGCFGLETSGNGKESGAVDHVKSNEYYTSGWGWNAPLHYEKPPQCLDPNQIPELGANDFDVEFFRSTRLWYLAGATKYGLNTYYPIFNSRYANTQREIDEMCPAAMFAIVGPIINSANGVQYTQNCTGPKDTYCYMVKDPATHDKGVDVFAALELQVFYLIATDSKSYAIYYSCNDYSYGDLQLITTQKYATPSVMKLFLSLLPTFNIHTSQAQAVICSAPKFSTPYPHPFENYPHSPGNDVISNNGWGQTNGWGR